MNFQCFQRMHFKCRNAVYPRSQLHRFNVPDDLVSWSNKWSDYKPVFYESDILTAKIWADSAIGTKNFNPKWNQIDDRINRTSYTGVYQVENSYPKNPEGRTGISGRGILGRWGPNHAADSIVTRWKLENGQKVFDARTKKPVLQMCVIQRHDTNEWAIPGGMVDLGEEIGQTLIREFMEEALNSLQQTDAKLADEQVKLITRFFDKGGLDVYRGYVDDPRNTDNAWMETTAVNFHDESNDVLPKLKFEAGDDAKHVTWMDINSNLKLYASHATFMKIVTDFHTAAW